MVTKRGTSNKNQSGSAEARRRRRAWLVVTYMADVKLYRFIMNDAEFEMTLSPREVSFLGEAEVLEVEDLCRCYRCGKTLTFKTLTVDRIIPGCQGGTYRRTNIRPACGECNSETGGSTRSKKTLKKLALVH